LLKLDDETLTLEEIAECLSTSHQNIHRIEQGAIRKIKLKYGTFKNFMRSIE